MPYGIQNAICPNHSFGDRSRSMKSNAWADPPNGRRGFIGGSDARIIMGNDENTLLRLWREKRGEAEPPDYSDNLIVQLGVATEPLNRRWYEKTTGQAIKSGPELDSAPSDPLDGR